MTQKQIIELRRVVEEAAVQALQKVKQAAQLSDDPDAPVDPERLELAAIGAVLLSVHIEGLVRASLPPEWAQNVRAFIDQMSKKVGDVLHEQAAKSQPTPPHTEANDGRHDITPGPQLQG